MTNFIDLFAGCGGLSLGLIRSGWTGVFAVERDADAFATYDANLLRSGHLPAFDWPEWLPRGPIDIRTLLADHKSDLGRMQGQIDLVAGSPPCQGFSTLGRRDPKDPRNRLFESYLEVVSLLKPHLLLMENVPAFDYTSGQDLGTDRDGTPVRRFSLLLKHRLWDLGYEVYSGVLKASDFGVAQSRPRFFLVGLLSRGSRDLHNGPFEILRRSRPEFLESLELPKDEISVSEAISDLEVGWAGTRPCAESPTHFEIDYKGPRTAYQRMLNQGAGTHEPNSLRLPNHRKETVTRFGRILEQCKPGSKIPAEQRLELGVRKHSIYLLHSDRPSPTLSTLPDDFVHYSEPRVLTVREMARLQGFPDWFSFSGKYTTGDTKRVYECPRYTQVGNAVAPLVAQALGLALKSAIQVGVKR